MSNMNDIPDIDQYETKDVKTNTTDTYQKLKEKVIAAMEAFKDKNKMMVHVKLSSIPSQKLIDELKAKKYTVKYELAYDNEDYTGNFRIYRPGYVASNFSDIIDVFSVSVPDESTKEIGEKFRNIMEKFAQLNTFAH